MTRVMIVDDEQEMSRLLKMLLEMEGFTVETSATGAGALEKAAVQAPDVFMVDYHLHDMSGEELIRKLRAVETLAVTPIVVASGRDVEPEVKRAGATEFILKPFEPDGLIELLNRMAAEAAAAKTTMTTAAVSTPAEDTTEIAIAALMQAADDTTKIAMVAVTLAHETIHAEDAAPKGAEAAPAKSEGERVVPAADAEGQTQKTE